MGKRTMSLADACALVPDDLPDGAFFAMAHDIAGADYGTAWGELDGYKPRPRGPVIAKTLPCSICGKKFASENDLRQHTATSEHKPKKKPKKGKRK